MTQYFCQIRVEFLEIKKLGGENKSGEIRCIIGVGVTDRAVPCQMVFPRKIPDNLEVWYTI